MSISQRITCILASGIGKTSYSGSILYDVMLTLMYC